MAARSSSCNSAITGLRQASPDARRDMVCNAAGLETGALDALSGANSLPLAIADGMIENVVGKFEIPLGVATNFTVNGKDYLVPMVVEEPSVIAAASFMAKLARKHGGFTAKSSDPIMRAQIQILGIPDLDRAEAAIHQNSDKIVACANAKDRMLVNLGGGCRDIETHSFTQTEIGPMLVVHLLVDVRDAMGANTVNTMAEAVAPLLEEITGGEVRLRILSNLADKRTVIAELRLPVESLATDNFAGERVARGIVEAYVFASVDPYRAATHNKGIMNGIDPVVVATGNDWRAIEAGAHAFAAKDGRYTSLTRWSLDESGCLAGRIELPMAVGLVGGATKTHPAAQAALALLNVASASELGEVIAAVGLAQNMAALRALSTEGIQRGHMALHARNIAIVAGARPEEADLIARKLVESGEITTDKAKALIADTE